MTQEFWTYFDLSEDDCNVIIHGDRRYFLFKIADDRKAFVSDGCPHRGGPLHMGSWDASCAKIRCPWHKYSWGEKAVSTRLIPAIRRGRQWSVVLPRAVARPYKIRTKIVERTAPAT